MTGARHQLCRHLSISSCKMNCLGTKRGFLSFTQRNYFDDLFSISDIKSDASSIRQTIFEHLAESKRRIQTSKPKPEEIPRFDSTPLRYTRLFRFDRIRASCGPVTNSAVRSGRSSPSSPQNPDPLNERWLSEDMIIR